MLTPLGARLVGLALLLVALPAWADGVITFRGNYWRDRNTRVVQPYAEIGQELPTGTVLGAHYLLDAITSASAAAGGGTDKEFTELRNEVGFSLGQRVGPALISGAYSYSAESDYWAHTVSLGALVELFQKNTTLGLTLAYGNDKVGQRMAATAYNVIGGLQTFRVIANLTQVLTRTLIGTASYEAAVVGFGSSDNGWQSNPYRLVSVAGSPVREVVPYQRVRESLSLALHWYLPTGIRLMPYLVLRPSFRLYWDDWGLLSETPELRVHVPVGPVEFRVTGRWYNQNSVSFWSEAAGKPFYAGNGVACHTCLLDKSRHDLFFTGDPKLGAFTSEFFELRLLIKLEGLRNLSRVPLVRWLGGGIVELSYGHYFNGGYAHTAFGDSEVAGLTISFPL